MKIAFVGDSYCASDSLNSYLEIIASHFNAEIVCRGLPGRALFHSYEILLEVIDETDYIIFCITEPYRLPNKYGASITTISGWQELDKNPYYKSIKLNNRIKSILRTATSEYYNNLISFKWHAVAQEGLLMLIDKLMLETKKRCIWFPCFNESMQGFVPKSGPIAGTTLLQIAENCLNSGHLNSDTLGDDIDGKWIQNHLDKPNNLKLANLIIDIINSNNFSPRPVFLAYAGSVGITKSLF
jgi:hypothetical protein